MSNVTTNKNDTNTNQQIHISTPPETINPHQKDQESTTKDDILKRPKDPSKWTLNQVKDWLSENNFDNFVQIFEKEKIDGLALILLSNQIILEMFAGSAPLGDRLKLNSQVEQLRYVYFWVLRSIDISLIKLIM